MQITNIEQLRNDLIDNYEKTKAKKMPLNMCKELTNAAGKVINTIQLELAYAALDKKIRIPYLEVDYPEKGTKKILGKDVIVTIGNKQT